MCKNVIKDKNVNTIYIISLILKAKARENWRELAAHKGSTWTRRKPRGLC